MTGYGTPDEQNNYSDDEPTQVTNYGAYGKPPSPAEEPWFRKPVALVAFGAVGTVLIALVVYGLAKAITGDSTSGTTPTTSLTPITSTQVPVAPPPSTVTETVTATTTPTTTSEATTITPTTTAPTTTTATSPTVSTSTVTQTETKTITEPPPAEPQP